MNKSTFIPNLDFITRGGISGQIIELYGKRSSVKSQICMFWSAKVAENEKEKCVLFIVTKNDCNVKRILDFVGDKEVLDRIIVMKLFKIGHVLKTLVDAGKNKIADAFIDMKKVQLICIDSVPSLFYPAVQDESWFAELSVSLISKLEKITGEFKTVCIFTNNAVTMRSTNETIPALGTFWSKSLRNRIKMSSVPSRENKSQSNTQSILSLRIEKFHRGTISKTILLKLDTKGLHAYNLE